MWGFDTEGINQFLNGIELRFFRKDECHSAFGFLVLSPVSNPGVHEEDLRSGRECHTRVQEKSSCLGFRLKYHELEGIQRQLNRLVNLIMKGYWRNGQW